MSHSLLIGDWLFAPLPSFRPREYRQLKTSAPGLVDEAIMTCSSPAALIQLNVMRRAAHRIGPTKQTRDGLER
jgi:NaMN:DMB phosphoribosyltransferase